MYIIEFDAVTDALGTVKTFRFSSASRYQTRPDDTPANAVYESRVINAGSYERHCWQRGTTRGTSQVSWGVVSLANADGGLDALIGYGLDGQAIRILRGPDPTRSKPVYRSTDFTPIFTGKLRRAQPSWDTIDLYLTDTWGDVGQKSLQLTKFAGSNVLPDGVEGTTDLLGKPKPKLRGTYPNFQPPCVNTSLLIYQIDDGTAILPLTITKVCDRGDTLGVGVQRSTLGALVTMSPAPSTYDWYAGSEGWYFRLGSSPIGQVTCFASEGVLANRTAAQIVSRVLSQEGGFSLSSIAGISALDAANSAECGIWVGDETTLQPFVDAIMDSVNGFVTDTRDGGMSLGRLADPSTLTSIQTFEAWQIKSAEGLKIQGSNDPGVGIRISKSVNGVAARYLRDIDATAGLPVYKVILNYGRVGLVQSASDLAGADLPTLAQVNTEYKTVTAENDTILVQHVNAPEFTVYTQLCNQTDGQAEANRQLALRGVPRYIVEIPLDLSDPILAAQTAQIDLMKGFTLKIDRFGWDNGQPLVCIGMVEDHGNLQTPAVTTIIAWG
jgi:hypothetical protein